MVCDARRSHPGQCVANYTLEYAMHNPLLSDFVLPPFAAIRPEHAEPALREVLARHRAQLAAIEAESAPSFASVAEPMEAMHHELSRTWSPVSHLNAVVNSDALRAAYNTCLPLLSDYQTDVGQSEALYRAYHAVEQREAHQLDAVQHRIVSNALRDFRLAGVALPADRKARFKAIMSELAQLGAKFDENVLDATNHWKLHVTDALKLTGINEAILAPAAQRARDANLPGWLMTLDQPTYVAVVTDCTSRELRRAYYEAWCTRASDRGPSADLWDNTAVIEQIVKLRHEAAQLIDFPSYAQYALATRMARSLQEVTDFLQQLAQAARPAAQREYAQLQAFAGQPLEAWDIAFYAERLQRSLFSVSQEELRPWFALPRVLSGLFDVAQRLFAVRIVERRDVSSWHADVRYYTIENLAGEVFASFYLDPYARPNKRSGAWMDECVGRKDIGAIPAKPVAYLVCNFLAPNGDAPALLTHDDVVTLFHEFGHGLHHMLTRVGYPSVAGINGVAWDAVELPSQFLENYAWHPQVLQQIAAHYQTDAALPADQQAQLIATRSFQAGMHTMRQIELALFDFRLHADYDPVHGARAQSVLEEVRRDVSVVPTPSWNRFAHNFGHIFAGGYAAGYYSYKWAEVLAADAFAAFEEAGVFDPSTAQRFLDAILARGGSRDPLEAFIEFRGRKPQIGPLLRLHGIAA